MNLLRKKKKIDFVIGREKIFHLAEYANRFREEHEENSKFYQIARK